LSWFRRQSKRQYELNSFHHLGVEEQWVDVTGRSFPMSWSKNARSRRVPVVKETSFDYTPEFWNIRPGTYLSGYFQSWRYLEPVAEQVRASVLDLLTPSEWFTAIDRQLASLGPWVSCHVRRGDYLVEPYKSVHGVVGSDFYRAAFSEVKNLVGSLPVVVFSDDITDARRTLDFLGEGAIFIESPAGSRPIESLILMSRSSASIIANSSFSWWSAWLSDHSNKVVVAPDPWFNGEYSHVVDLIPPHWRTIRRKMS